MSQKLPSLGGNAVIASIFPLACPKVMLPHGDGTAFMSEYTIPACAKGQFKTLAVWDSFEKRRDLMAPQENGQPAFTPFPVLATGPYGIAADLVRQWSSSMIAMGDGTGAGPGVMVIAENVADPENFQPSAEQLVEMKSRQARWFDALYYEADQIHKDKDSKKKGYTITVLHRAAAEWLGRKPDWTDQVATGEEIKDCPACGSKIKSTVAVCPTCRTQLQALPASIANLPGNADMASEAQPEKPTPVIPPVKSPQQSARA